MRSVNRQQLEYFLAVAEHGSLGHAAVAAGVSQPSLSQALGTLEKELGAALVRRVRRGPFSRRRGTRSFPTRGCCCVSCAGRVR